MSSLPPLPPEPPILARLAAFTPTPPPDPLAMIETALALANDRRLETDSQLRHALRACDYMARLIRYQQEQIGWLVAAEQLREQRP